jgi:hypothetical protein
VRTVKLEIVLLDNRLAINLALHACRRKRKQKQSPDPRLQLHRKHDGFVIRSQQALSIHIYRAYDGILRGA